MNKNERHLLSNYQHLMDPHERMVARWLTEEWNEEDKNIPRWLKNQVYSKFLCRNLENPKSLVSLICLKLLEKHKHEISLPKT